MKLPKKFKEIHTCVECRKRRNIDSSDIKNIICKTDKHDSLLFEKNKKKRIKKSWCNNCHTSVDKCSCLKRYRDWS